VAERGAVGPRDGIVVLELSLDDNREISDVIACMRAGALAWERLPSHGAVDESGRGRRVHHVLDVAQELEDGAAKIHAARESFYRSETKRHEREARERERAR
jgi:hypothetical protein